MAKPIFLIKVQTTLSPKYCEHIGKTVANHLNEEYHVFVAAVQTDPNQEPEFIVLNADGIPESTIEEIKALVNPLIIPAPAPQPATGFNTDRFE